MSDLRRAWSAHIDPGDYEQHMANVGQAQANADLLVELFREHPPLPGSRVHIAGAGTGQHFDYFPPAILAPYEVVFTDINPRFLDVLRGRMQGFPCAIQVDDIEAPAAGGLYALTIAILVLEHVDWRRALAGICSRTDRAFFVIQEDPPVLPARTLPGTLAILREARPHRIPRDALIEASRQEGFELTRVATRDVPDSKRMAGFDFIRRR
jgi:SAM-dependent methyltransferase